MVKVEFGPLSQSWLNGTAINMFMHIYFRNYWVNQSQNFDNLNMGALNMLGKNS